MIHRRVRMIVGYDKSNDEIAKCIQQAINEELKQGYELEEIKHNPDTHTNPSTLIIFWKDLTKEEVDKL